MTEKKNIPATKAEKTSGHIETQHPPKNTESIQASKEIKGSIAYETLSTDHKEQIVTFKRGTNKLNSLLSALPKENSAKTSVVLNKILKEKGLGGINGSSDSFAYFKETEFGPLLVLNTIADGKKNEKLGDFDVLLERIRIALEDGKKLDASDVMVGLRRKYIHLLGMQELELTYADSGYQRDIHDGKRLLALVGLDSTKDLYLKKNAAIRKNIAEIYKNFITDFKEHPAETEQDKKFFQATNDRFTRLLGHNLDTGKTTVENVGEFLSHGSTWLDMGKYAWYGALGELGALGMAVLTPFILIITGIIGGGKLIGSEKAREDFMKKTIPSIGGAIKKMFNYVQKNALHPEEIMKDVGKYLKEKGEEITKLPPEEQARAIGNIAGEIIGMIEGWLILKWALKSSFLRLKFNVPASVRMPISKITNWATFEKYIEQIDHLRFREGWGADKIMDTINAVRKGEMKLTDIPDVGGIRSIVKKLLDEGGCIAEGKTFLGKAASVTKFSEKLYERASAGVHEMYKKSASLFENALGGRIMKSYDIFDAAITRGLGYLGKTGAIPGAVMAEIIDAQRELKAVIREADFPGKTFCNLLVYEADKHFQSLLRLAEKTKDVTGVTKLETMVGENVKRVKTTVSEKANTTQEWLTKTNRKFRNLDEATGFKKVEKGQFTEKIGKSERLSLGYNDGVGQRMVSENGKIKYELFNNQGKLIIKERFDEIIKVGDGKAMVRTKKGIGIIKIDGTWEVPIQKWITDIHVLEEGGKKGYVLGFKNAKTGEHSYRFSEDGIFSEQATKYEFFTGLDEGMGVFAKDVKSGNQLKYIIDIKNGGKPIPIKTPDQFLKDPEYKRLYSKYTPHIDSFTKEWVAAIRLPDGKWSVINKNGEYVFKENGLIATRESQLEALQYYYKEAKIWEFKSTLTNLDDLAVMCEQLEAKLTYVLRDSGGLTYVRPSGIDDLYEFATKNGKKGIIRGSNRKVLINADYSHIQIMDAQHGFMRVEKNGKWGIVDLENNVLTPAKFHDINLLDEKSKLFSFSVKENGEELVGIMDKNGKELLPAKYTHINMVDDGVFEGVQMRDWNVVGKSKRIYSAERTASRGGGSDVATGAVIATGVSNARKVSVTDTAEMIGNPRIHAIYEGDLYQIAKTFGFDKKPFATNFEKALLPFNIEEITTLLRLNFIKSIDVSRLSEKAIRNLNGYLKLRIMELTKAFKDAVDALNLTEKPVTMDNVLSVI